MTDTIKEARALVARITSDDEATRLLAALADECERLRSENARLREAMPSPETLGAIQSALGRDPLRKADFQRVASWLARLDAATKPRCQACWKRSVGGSKSGKRCAWCAEYGAPLRERKDEE